MFAAELEKIIPDLRAYARMLCGDPARADDIVQNACLKAWDARASFVPEKGSFKGWMMTITRNEFLQDVRKQKRVDNYAPSDIEDWLVEECQLSNQAECSEAIAQLFQLGREQRDVFILVIAMGYSYEEAARICDCSIGTIKSRISRARSNLACIRARADELEATDMTSTPVPHTLRELCGYADRLVQSAA